MQRRDLLKMIAAVTGCAMVGIAVDARELAAQPVMGAREQVLLDEIAEAILPATGTPGAKAAGCGAAMVVLINDCYQDSHQQLLKDGLVAIQALARQQFQQDFVALPLSGKQQLLQALDKAAVAQQVASAQQATKAQQGEQPDNLPHYFTLLKQLTLFSFFTSKAGCTEVLRYVAVPGKYVGDLPYKKGDRAWALGG